MAESGMDAAPLPGLLFGVVPGPSGEGCLECEEAGGWWFHLRRCVLDPQAGCRPTGASNSPPGGEIRRLGALLDSRMRSGSVAFD